MSRSGRALLFALVLVPTLALAQTIAPEARIPLSTGFVPDPVHLEGHAHGGRALEDLGGHECTGFVGDRANHVMMLDTRFGFLRIFATSQTDLVLGVHWTDASGHPHWLCSDDRFDDAPGVEGVFPRGRLEIWVGTHTIGESGDYVLDFTEMRSVRPGIGTGEAGLDRSAATELGLDLEADARYDDIHLHRGFLPDPRWLEGEAGLATVAAGADAGTDVEPIEVTLLGNGCGGLVQASAGHVVTLLDDFDFLQLYLCEPAEEGSRCVPTHEPLSLVVLLPNGAFRCEAADASFTALSAGADEGGWPAGDYRVWVGVHHTDTHQRYRMGVSELRRVN
jgi:hypothetical protein